MTDRVVLIGIGPGDPEQITLEAIRAMNDADYFVVTEKRRPDGDPLAAARTALLARHVADEPTVIVVEDPERDRRAQATTDATGYGKAVTDWHEARAAAYASALADRDGTAAFLVWGDPALYDSTIRVLERVARTLGAELDVVPGVSSVSALAARHRIVLHGIGEPVVITTGRRLEEALSQGHTNIAVMLNRSLDELDAVDPQAWQIWWGANLGTTSEELVAGRLGEVLSQIRGARERAKIDAGWVMDVYLLRRTTSSQDAASSRVASASSIDAP